MGKAGIGADDPAGADEQGLAAGPLHDARMRGGRRVQDGQHLVAAMDQLLKAGGLRAAHGVSPFRCRKSWRGMPASVEKIFAALRSKPMNSGVPSTKPVAGLRAIQSEAVLR